MSQIQTPFFSIIIATYNAADTICRSIESVLSQTEPAQILVMDGLSSDDTVVLARRYEVQGVAVHTEKDRGVYDAWNKGLNYAQGQWIIFLGADDYYGNPNALSTLRHALTDVSDHTKIVYGRVEIIDDTGKVVAVDNKPWDECRSTLRKNMPYTHVASAHHASIFLERKFDPEFKIAGDYNFLYPLLLKQDPIFLPEYVAQMGGGGLSTNLKTRYALLMELKKIRRSFRINPGLINKLWTIMKIVYYKFLVKLLL